MKIMLFPVACAAMLVAGCATTAEPAYDTLIAHRGESKDAPENTLPAYRMAVDRGFGFECDIYLSSDNRLYTFHDTTLKRTTSGANTNACTAVDWDGTVSKLNVGGWGNTQNAIEQSVDGGRINIGSSSRFTVDEGRWYDLRVEVMGDSMATYFDG